MYQTKFQSKNKKNRFDDAGYEDDLDFVRKSKKNKKPDYSKDRKNKRNED